MPDVNLNDYYSAGYFLLRANHPGWDIPTALFPEHLISLSGCICPRLVLTWGWSPGSQQEAVDFGIPVDEFEALAAWCQNNGDSEFGFPGVFYSTDNARRAVKRFRIPTETLYIIGVGFPRDLEEMGWPGAESDDRDYGIKQQIMRHLPLASGGEVLGHEVVSFDHGDFGHSWVCNHIYEEPFGFSPNSRGLISRYEDARKVYDWIAEDDLKGLRAEPEPYYIWLLVSYP